MMMIVIITAADDRGLSRGDQLIPRKITGIVWCKFAL